MHPGVPKPFSEKPPLPPVQAPTPTKTKVSARIHAARAGGARLSCDLRNCAGDTGSTSTHASRRLQGHSVKEGCPRLPV